MNNFFNTPLTPELEEIKEKHKEDKDKKGNTDSTKGASSLSAWCKSTYAKGYRGTEQNLYKLAVKYCQKT